MNLFFKFGFITVITFVALGAGGQQIQFPVASLGGCASQEDCKVYCDSDEHHKACQAFAKDHEIVKDQRIYVDNKIDQSSSPNFSGPGGCATSNECRDYCEEELNRRECIDYAEDNGHITSQEANEERRFLETLENEFEQREGPGGCLSEVECHAFCENPDNVRLCVTYARDHGFMSEAEAKKILSRQERSNEGPGGCTNERECQAYCKDPSHINECIDHGLRNGFISSTEAEKIRGHVRRGRIHEEDFVGPGECRGEIECRTYCEDVDHLDECIDFAVREGFMTEDEAEEARKFAGFRDVEGPGGCRGEDCRNYCDDSSRAQECLDFALDNGLIPPEEAERARKFIAATEVGGPGGCRFDECRDYCENPQHEDECFEFVSSNGLISEEEIKDIEVGRSLLKKVEESGGPGGCTDDASCMAICQNPENFEECLSFASVHGGLSEVEAKRMLLDFTSGERHYGPQDDFRPASLGGGAIEKFRRFEDFKQLEKQFRGGSAGGSGGFPGAQGSAGPEGPQGSRSGGPGGCKTPEECFKYCFEHRQECGLRGPPSDGNFPGQRVLDPSGLIHQDRGPRGNGSRLASRPSIKLVREEGGNAFSLSISGSVALQRFVLNPREGSRYSSDLSCVAQYENDRVIIRPVGLTAKLTSCDGDVFEYDFIERGDGVFLGVELGSGARLVPELDKGSTSGRLPEGIRFPDQYSDELQIPGEPDGEFRIPEGFEGEARRIQEEEFRRRFKTQAPDGFIFPEGDFPDGSLPLKEFLKGDPNISYPYRDQGGFIPTDDAVDPSYNSSEPEPFHPDDFPNGTFIPNEDGTYPDYPQPYQDDGKYPVNSFDTTFPQPDDGKFFPPDGDTAYPDGGSFPESYEDTFIQPDTTIDSQPDYQELPQQYDEPSYDEFPYGGDSFPIPEDGSLYPTDDGNFIPPDDAESHTRDLIFRALGTVLFSPVIIFETIFR